ncbi:MAG: cobalamin B12-binding domain-containing protein [Armatimonadetes bacterium]|nr:cobalamin B12-binding domain-containing protein [Armatimonadota bacterium]
MQGKIAFIDPPLTMKQRYGRLAFAGNTMPSLGLCWLAATAEKEGCEARIIEACSLNLDHEETLRQALDFSPNWVGITATTCSIHSAGKLAQMIKARNPRIRTIIGGHHLSALPEETMKAFPDFDLGVIGEGEGTLRELLRTDGTGDFGTISGLVYRDNGKARIAERRPYIKNLDELPFPAWNLLAEFPGRYRPPLSRFQRLPAASLVTTRGCPNKCTFCDNSVFSNTCRRFSPDYCFEMIKILYLRYGIREILFEDDTFFVFKNNVRAMCEKILKAGLDLSWSCLGRADAVDAELLGLMRRAGCWQIAYGIESGSQEILDLMQKKTKLDKVRAAVELTKRTGIQAKGFFILGFPSENRETLRKTVAFARDLDLDDMTVTQFTPLPGSRMYEVIEQYGDFDKDWKKTTLLETVFVPRDLTKGELRNHLWKMIRRFYLRPRILLSYLARMVKCLFLSLRLGVERKRERL